jgi:superfamily I DNA/RNA helicase
MADNRIRNLKEIIGSMDSPEVNRSLPALERLGDALSDLALDTSRGDDDDKVGDEVTLITTHSCKGLEFPHVYIVGLEEGLMPHMRAKEEGTLDEERRLFYVALTRAMRTLTITYCAGRKKYGQMTPAHPSSFLRELPPELVDHETSAARKPVAAGQGKSLFAGMRERVAQAQGGAPASE